MEQRGGVPFWVGRAPLILPDTLNWVLSSSVAEGIRNSRVLETQIPAGTVSLENRKLASGVKRSVRKPSSTLN